MTAIRTGIWFFPLLIAAVGLPAGAAEPAAADLLPRENASEPSGTTARSATWESWQKLTRGGKGILAAKIRHGFGAPVVLFPGTNTATATSSIARHDHLRFDSVDQLAEFLKEIGTGIHLRDGSHAVVDDAGTLLPFTDEEARKLRFGDPLEAKETALATDQTLARPVDFPLFNWVRRGRLYWYDNYNGGVFAYRTPSGSLSVISGDPVKVQAVLRAEINDVRLIPDFLRDRLPHVMLYFLGSREAYILNRDYLERRDAVPTELWPPEAARDLGKSEATLRKHIAEPFVVIDGLDWTLAMAVTNHDGSIERWEMVGRGSPLSIVTFRRTPLENAGTVVPGPRGGLKAR